MQHLSIDKSSQRDVPFMVEDSNGKPHDIYIFDTRISCYMVATMLGIIHHKTSEVDNDQSRKPANIMLEQIDSRRDELMRIYRHMVLSDATPENIDEKIKEAFAVTMSDEESDRAEKKMDSYARGGLELLDKMFCDCKTMEDVCNVILDLLEEIMPYQEDSALSS